MKTLLGVCANLQVAAPLGIRWLTGQNSRDFIPGAANPSQTLQHAITYRDIFKIKKQKQG